MRIASRRNRVLAAILFAAAPAWAWDSTGYSSKKELGSNAYDRWNRIVSPALSDDGKWVVYTLQSGAGVAELVVRATQENTEFRVPRGLVPRRETPNSPSYSVGPV